MWLCMEAPYYKTPDKSQMIASSTMAQQVDPHKSFRKDFW